MGNVTLTDEQFDALEQALRASAELLTLSDTRLLHAGRIAAFARHAVLCERNGPPCTCKLADLVVAADEYNKSTEALSWDLVARTKAAYEVLKRAVDPPPAQTTAQA